MKLILTPILLCLFACGQSAPNTTLEFPGGQAPLNKYFSMVVTSDADWATSIEVDADMPAHGHGMIVKPVVAELGPQRWQVNGMKFHMPGAWEVYIDLINGDRREHQIIPVNVEPF